MVGVIYFETRVHFLMLYSIWSVWLEYHPLESQMPHPAVTSKVTLNKRCWLPLVCFVHIHSVFLSVPPKEWFTTLADEFMFSPLIGLTSSCNTDTAVPTMQHLPLHLPKPELWLHWVFLFSLLLTTLFLRFPRQRGQHLLSMISVFLRLHSSLLPLITLSASAPPEERDNYIASIVFICSWSTMYLLGFIFLGEFCVAISKEVKKLYRHCLREGNMAHHVSSYSMVGIIQSTQWGPAWWFHPVLISGNRFGCQLTEWSSHMSPGNLIRSSRVKGSLFSCSETHNEHCTQWNEKLKLGRHVIWPSFQIRL